ncbi:MAG: hypothetical protein WCO57_03750 [Verrucomicrobiota bacterium]
MGEFFRQTEDVGDEVFALGGFLRRHARGAGSFEGCHGRGKGLGFLSGAGQTVGSQIQMAGKHAFAGDAESHHVRITDAYQDAGQDMLDHELPGKHAPFTADPIGLQLLRERENFIKDAGNDMWGEIRDTLDQGLQQGESFAKLSARVRESFNGMSKERAMRIAVTETGIAFESARHRAMVEAGVEWKVTAAAEEGAPGTILYRRRRPRPLTPRGPIASSSRTFRTS